MIKFYREIQTKFDNFVKNNKTLMMIILCWSVLIFYLCLKIFFGYYIEFATKNENFIMFCNFIDANIYVNYILSCSISYVMFHYYYCALLGKQKLDKKELIILLVMILVTNILCNIGIVFSLISDIIKFWIIPSILLFKNYKKLNLKSIIFVTVFAIINLIFQLLSALARNIGIKIIQDSSFVSMLLSLDVLIMIILYYLYGKDGRFMGFLLGKWFGKTKSFLENQKQKKMLKIKALEKDIKEIDEELERQKNENK